MKIAILGSRGIPVNYGGFETLAEELTIRLAQKGNEVTVYCLKPYSKDREKYYKNVKRIFLPTIRTKVLEKPVFAILSLLSALFKKYDIILMLGISVSSLCFIPRLFGKKVIINVDGLEWQRKKWNKIISSFLKFQEKMAGLTADKIVTDCRNIKEYYYNKYGVDSVYISYGAEIIDYPSGKEMQKYGLTKDGYILYVSRFEPENNPLLVREAFEEIGKQNIKLVMIGDAPYADSYIKKVKNTVNPDIIFTGYLFGDAYKELLSNAYFYIQATEVGGTHPALVQAMAAGKCILANDIPAHREVLRDTGIYFKNKDTLKKGMIELLLNKEIVRIKGKEAQKIAVKEYSWDKITEEYERLFLKIINSK